MTKLHARNIPRLERFFPRIEEDTQKAGLFPGLQETGYVVSVQNGIARVAGLPGLGLDELVRFPGSLMGIAFNIEEQLVSVVLLGSYSHIRAGDEVSRTSQVMDVPVGNSLLGRVIDPLGNPLDELGPLGPTSRLPMERRAPGILDRSPVTEPLQTGIKVIDALIPIGRGQRQLLMGDRQTGKTAIALNTILNQRDQGVLCVYCAIGQRASAVARAMATLREGGALGYTTVVVTEGNDPPGLKYIAPYAATSMAEQFMAEGRDVLIVYDDLSSHATAYREISLLMRRPPGREAFPGDIFYIHSRLLERATHLRKEYGGGSLTALPVIETEAQNLAAYIPTNLISITDGQIFLSPVLFSLGILPAVDMARSVSRVGGKAQHEAYRDLTGRLKLEYAQFEELENFSRFGTLLDSSSRKILDHGRRIRSVLMQPEFEQVPVPGQILVFSALNDGLFDEVSLADMDQAERKLRSSWNELSPDLIARLSKAFRLSEEDRSAVRTFCQQVLKPFKTPADG